LTAASGTIAFLLAPVLTVFTVLLRTSLHNPLLTCAAASALLAIVFILCL